MIKKIDKRLTELKEYVEKQRELIIVINNAIESDVFVPSESQQVTIDYICQQGQLGNKAQLTPKNCIIHPPSPTNPLRWKNTPPLLEIFPLWSESRLSMTLILIHLQYVYRQKNIFHLFLDRLHDNQTNAFYPG